MDYLASSHLLLTRVVGIKLSRSNAATGLGWREDGAGGGWSSSVAPSVVVILIDPGGWAAVIPSSAADNITPAPSLDICTYTFAGL